MKAELHTTPAIFDILAGEWDGLLDPERSEYFFMTLDWQRIWWKHLGWGDLSVVTARDEMGKLLGIGPWFTDTVNGQRVVRTIGSKEVADYLDTILSPGQEEAILGALIDYMLSASAPSWDVLELCNIPQTSPTLVYLPRLCEARGLRVTISLEDVCPVLDLPESYEDYLISIDKKQRHELRRKRRRIEEAGDVVWYVVGPKHDLQAEIASFLRLMALSTTEKARFLQEPGHQAFFREIGTVMFAKGHLELIFLTVKGHPAAAMWQFTYGDRVLLYNSGLDMQFSALSPGIALLTYAIEHAIQRGYKKYDFLQGDEIYKYRMGAKTTTVHNLTIWRS